MGSCPMPRPIVDGDDCEGGFKAIGQRTGRTKPLPRAAYRYCELAYRNQMCKTKTWNWGTVTYSSERCAIAATVYFLRKFPCVAVE